MNRWRDYRKMRAVMILFGITVLLPLPVFAQYASEWHEWHGQEWNGAPSWLPPLQPALGYEHGSSYPADSYYHPNPTYGYSYGYPYDPPPYRYGYSAGFSDGFNAGYDHGFTGGLNDAFASAYAARPYGVYYGYGASGYPYAYHGY